MTAVRSLKQLVALSARISARVYSKSILSRQSEASAHAVRKRCVVSPRVIFIHRYQTRRLGYTAATRQRRVSKHGLGAVRTVTSKQRQAARRPTRRKLPPGAPALRFLLSFPRCVRADSVLVCARSMRQQQRLQRFVPSGRTEASADAASVKGIGRLAWRGRSRASVSLRGCGRSTASVRGASLFRDKQEARVEESDAGHSAPASRRRAGGAHRLAVAFERTTAVPAAVPPQQSHRVNVRRGTT